MKITDIKVHLISAELSKTFWMSIEAYRTASEVLVQVFTDEGIVGIGQAHGRPLPEIARIIEEGFKPAILGEDPLAHEHLWQRLFAYTHTRRGSRFSESPGQPHFGGGARPQMMAAIAGLDIALWDIKGKACGLPVYRLLGGESSRVPAYASGGYYENGKDLPEQIDALMEEIGFYQELGYTAAKIKVGGLPVKEDIERVRAVRDAFHEIDIMLDANSAYDVPTAIQAARAFEPFDVRWFEEPLHWYDPVFGIRRVAAATRILIASGESALHRWAARDLIEHAGIRIMQFDATRAGGVTEWLKVAACAASHGILMAPHHDPHVHGHLIAAVPNGYVQETFPNPMRDPLWEELYDERPVIERGVLQLSEKPGFGVELREEAVRRYSVQAH